MQALCKKNQKKPNKLHVYPDAITMTSSVICQCSASRVTDDFIDVLSQAESRWQWLKADGEPVKQVFTCIF